MAAATPQKPTLLYVQDTLCGWCFGFSPVMQALAEAFEGQLDVHVLSGGLSVGERAVPIGQAAAYIREALGHVEAETGVQFGTGFQELLTAGRYRYDSTPPAVALALARAQAPDQALAYAHGLHQLLFVEGRNLNQSRAYEALNRAHGVDHAVFAQRFAAPEAVALAEQDYQLAQRLGATGFPVLILSAQDELYLLCRGYVPFDSLHEGVTRLLAEVGAGSL